jgi:hypothetical protein
VDEYLCLTVLSHEGESEADFKSRLAVFWTHMLRNKPDDYERVYAEATQFENYGTRTSRKYLVEADVIDGLEAELGGKDVAFEPVDRDDVYTKYEAAPPEWFWIEH